MKSEAFAHPTGDSAYAGHTQTTINDAAGNRKIWHFTQGDALGWKNGLQYKQEVYQGQGVTLLRTFLTDWTQDQPGVAELRNPRPSAQRTKLNDVTPALESRREQDVDGNGNVTQVREFSYTDAVNPVRTLTATYLNTTPYTSRNILNRSLTMQLHVGGAGGTVISSGGNAYDWGTLANVSNPNMHDTAYGTSFTVRGNAWSTTPLGGPGTTQTFDILGKARTVTDSSGHQQTIGYLPSTGYTAPSTGNSGTPLGTSMQWNGDLTLNSASAASGESVSYAWDNAKRPTSQQSPSGSWTSYTYNDTATPPTILQTTQVHKDGVAPPAVLNTSSYTITRTLDGLGRVVKVHDSRANAYVEYQYDACSCSPTGRQVKVSNPYLQGETAIWTTTTYDALGRTTAVGAPDGSATTTSYSGNTTTVTDPAGKRKKFTYDSAGNLMQVAEPDAQGNLTVLTNYTYDPAGRLTDVSMNGGAQTRHFTYNAYGQVLTAMNPENGTVTYTYNDNGSVATKTDAKSQVTNFQYDTYNRLTRIYPGGSYGYEKRFYYDEYAADQGQNTYGRLAGIEWDPGQLAPNTPAYFYRHAFGYTTYGAMTRSKLVRRYDNGLGDWVEEALEADFTWTMQGEVASMTYPSGRQLYYKFDAAGRPNGLVGVASWEEPPWTIQQKNLVTSTAFNKAGQMTTLAALGGTETRSYDSSTLQLSGIQTSGVLDLTYVYPAAGTNNGRITAETNNLTNTTVSYTYDGYNRLGTATSVTGGTTNWGLSFSYDVYGNRTAQTVTAGTAPAFSATFNSSNQMVGYSFDNNGNQLTTPDGATLEYDADNRMTRWTRQSTSEYYQYHPSGWRVASTVELHHLYLHGPGGQMLTAYTSSGAVAYSENVYFAGRLVFTMSGEAGGTTTLTALQTDRLGTVRSSNWTARNYYPFGEEIGSSANDQYKYASTYRDSTTGLDYAVNRYYASGTARFTTPDPLGS